MKRFELQGVELPVAVASAFAYVADPQNLPAWTEAFRVVDGERAVMRTPTGEVEIRLRVAADPAFGAIDWYMTFPDGTVAAAYSRVVPLSEDRSAYSFILTPPPGPLEQIEGSLSEQANTLAKELDRLVSVLGRR